MASVRISKISLVMIIALTPFLSRAGGEMESDDVRAVVPGSNQSSLVTPLPKAVAMGESTHKESEGSGCPICYDPLEAVATMRLRCAHEVCSTCYQQLQQYRHTKCPVCRAADVVPHTFPDNRYDTYYEPYWSYCKKVTCCPNTRHYLFLRGPEVGNSRCQKATIVSTIAGAAGILISKSLGCAPSLGCMLSYWACPLYASFCLDGCCCEKTEYRLRDR